MSPFIAAQYSFFVQNYDNPPYNFWIQWRDPSGTTGRSFLNGVNGGFVGSCCVIIPGEVWIDAPAVPGNTYWLALVDLSGATLSLAPLGVATNGVVASYSFTVNGGALLQIGVTYSDVPPTITAEPSDQTVTEGQEATFTVTASGLALTYQWTKSGISLPGATSASYTTPPTMLADNGAIFGVIVANSGGNATSKAAFLVVNPSPSTLPRPWLDQDVGSPTTPGTAQYNAATGTFTLTGSGMIFGGSSDQAHFAFQTLTGDGAIIARLAGLGTTNTGALAGVLIRESLNADSTYAMTALTLTGGVVFGYRTSTGGTAASTAGPMVSVPAWVEVVRNGDSFTSVTSPDGVTWTPIGAPVTIPMATTVYIGLTVASGTSIASTTARIDQVSGSGGWPQAAVGGGGGRSSSGGGCGASGLEPLILLGLFKALRRLAWSSYCRGTRGSGYRPFRSSRGQPWRGT